MKTTYEKITLKKDGYDYICNQDKRFTIVNAYNGEWEIWFKGKSIGFGGALRYASDTIKEILNNGYFHFYNKEFDC